MRYLLIILFGALWPVLSVSALELSEDATISLLTCTPGQVNYNAYGHSALRVYDPDQALDLVYNYGTFDTGIENFVVKFARGEVQYSLEIESFRRFVANYDYFDRSIYEQTLNLDQNQKQELFDFLTENAKTENKYYWYDFIFNNCSTVLRDVLEEISGVEFSRAKSKVTFRDLIDHYNQYGEWNDLGIDLLLGARIDRCAREYETMFLPDYLMSGFDDATIQGKPLVSGTRTIVENGYEYYRETGWMSIITPGRLFWALFLIFLVAKIYIKPGRTPVFSVTFLTILGLAGWFLILMWFGTRHDATKWNLNILWMLPLHFPMAFFLLMKEKPRWVVKYFHIARVILITILILWPLFWPQNYHIACLPLMLMALLAISSNVPVMSEAVTRRNR